MVFEFILFLKGSITYLGFKGVLKLYYKQKQYLRQAHRQIKSFESVISSDAASAAGDAATSSRRASNHQVNLNSHLLQHESHHITNYRVESNIRLERAAIDADESSMSSSSSTYSSSLNSSSVNNNNLDEDIEAANNFSD